MIREKDVVLRKSLVHSSAVLSTALIPLRSMSIYYCKKGIRGRDLDPAPEVERAERRELEGCLTAEGTRAWVRPQKSDR